jgi:hypothetical protein
LQRFSGAKFPRFEGGFAILVRIKHVATVRGNGTFTMMADSTAAKRRVGMALRRPRPTP